MRDTAAKARLEAQLVELEGRQTRIARGQAVLIAREIASVKRTLMRIEEGTPTGNV
jgi:hypothetical protein